MVVIIARMTTAAQPIAIPIIAPVDKAVVGINVTVFFT
jgi:hypothetical protein